MTHSLRRQKQPLHAAGPIPMIASLRYQCACAAQEVITIQVVMDLKAHEETFVWTMRQLWRDVMREAEQHANQGNP